MAMAACGGGTETPAPSAAGGTDAGDTGDGGEAAEGKEGTGDPNNPKPPPAEGSEGDTGEGTEGGEGLEGSMGEGTEGSEGPEGEAEGPEGEAEGPEGEAEGPEGEAEGPEGEAEGPEGEPEGLEGDDTDAGIPDAGVPDAGVPDDAGIPDAGVPDDAGIPDAGVPDDAGVENQPPKITIISPIEDKYYKSSVPIDFKGSAFDPEDGQITNNLKFRWKSSVQGPIGTGPIISGQLDALGDHVITLSVTDSQGLEGTSQVLIHVVKKLPPIVVIDKPKEGEQIHTGDKVRLKASVTDPETPGNTNFFYEWSSSVDGKLANGNDIDVTLKTNGIHILSCKVTDLADNTRFTQVAVSVEMAVNFPPKIQIIKPADNSLWALGQELEFAARADDPEDGVNPASFTYKWASSTTDPIPTGRVVKTVLPTLGEHIITLTVTDPLSSIVTATAKITITDKKAPTATISSPSPNASFLEGAPITLTGSATDPEDGALPANSLSWTSDRAATPIGQGSPVIVSSLPSGDNVITLTAIDSDGLSGSDSIAIKVLGKPQVTITSPATDRFTVPKIGDDVQLQGTIVDEDANLKGSWFSSITGSVAQNANSAAYKAPIAGKHVIRFTATDKDNLTGEDSAIIIVNPDGAPVGKSYTSSAGTLPIRGIAKWLGDRYLLATDAGLLDWDSKTDTVLAQYTNAGGAPPVKIPSDNVKGVASVVGAPGSPSSFAAATDKGLWGCRDTGGPQLTCVVVNTTKSLPQDSTTAVVGFDTTNYGVGLESKGVALVDISSALVKAVVNKANATGLTDERTTALAVLPSGAEKKVYMGTPAGANVITLTNTQQTAITFTKANTNNKLPSDNIFTVWVVNSIRYFGTDAGLARFDSATSSWKTYAFNEGIDAAQVRSVVTQPRTGKAELVFLATEKGVYRLDDNGGQPLVTLIDDSDGMSSKNASTLCINGGTKLFGTDKGVFRWLGD